MTKGFTRTLNGYVAQEGVNRYTVFFVRLYRDLKNGKKARSSGFIHLLRVSDAPADFGGTGSTLCGEEFTLASVGDHYISEEAKAFRENGGYLSEEMRLYGHVGRGKVTCPKCFHNAFWVRKLPSMPAPKLIEDRTLLDRNAYSDLLEGDLTPPSKYRKK